MSGSFDSEGGRGKNVKKPKLLLFTRKRKIHRAKNASNPHQEGTAINIAGREGNFTEEKKRPYTMDTEKKEAFSKKMKKTMHGFLWTNAV